MAIKHEPIDDSQLIARITEQVSAADFTGTDELSERRERSTRAYTGEKSDGLRPTTGLSTIANNKTQPAVETLTTYLTNIFCSDQETVVFSPLNEAMRPAASQLSKMVDHVLHRYNNGYYVLNRFIKDAAINGTVVVEVGVDKTPSSFKEVYEGTEEQIGIMISEKESQGYTSDIMSKEKKVEVLEISSDEGSVTGEFETYVVTVKFSRTKCLPVISNVPPEEFLIVEGATAINGDPKNTFCCRRQQVPVSVILSDERFKDIDEEELISLANPGDLETDYEKTNRHSFDGTYNYGNASQQHGNNREVELIRSFINADVDGDGIEEKMEVFSVGNNILFKQEWFGDIPYESFCFFPIPNKFYGLSVSDKIEDYHNACSALLRSEVDVRLLQNTYRIIASENSVNMRDLQSGRPGIVRAKPGFESKDIQVLPAPAGANNTANILDYLHREIAGQIGIDPNTGQISTDAEKSGNDAAKTSMVQDNASAKIQMYAREFADTALRGIIWQISQLLVEYADYDSVKELAAKITPETPEVLMAQESFMDLFDKDDLIAKVGLGHQTAIQKIQGIQSIIGVQTALEQSPVSPTPIPYKNKLAANLELAKAMGFEDPSQFFPSEAEVQQAQQAQAQQQQQQLQLQMQLQQQEAGIKDREVGVKEQALAQKAEAETQKLQKEAEEIVVGIENTKEDNALNVRRQEAQEEMMAANIEMQRQNQQLQRELAELKARTDLEKQRIADEKTINLKRSGGE